MPIKDRRSSVRVEIEGRARIFTHRDEFAGRCLDLGLDGIALRSTRAARPGELVTLEAVIDGQPLRVDAKLVRRQRAAGEYVLGLSFEDLDLDTQRRIEHLMFERLAGSPRAEFMRAFVAHADRVPPPVTREGAVEHTVLASMSQVPVISGHTQVVSMSQLALADRTMIAPLPERGETVVAELAGVLEVLEVSEEPEEVPEDDPGVPDDTWLDDEMDTAQFRLLEAAQARERAEREAEDLELAQLQPDDPVPEHTVVVGGFAVQPLVEPTPLVREEERPPNERTLVMGDATEPAPRQRTSIIADAPEPTERQRTLITTDAPERPLVERTAPLISGALFPPPRTVGAPETVAPTSTLRVPLEPDAQGDRTVPFLRDLLLGVRRLDPSTPERHAPEHTALVRRDPTDADAVLRPSLRALLEAKALLRPDPPASSRPRVIVAIPHSKHRRVASAPWNQR